MQRTKLYYSDDMKSNLTMMWKYANDKDNFDAVTRSNIVHAMKNFPLENHEIHMLPVQDLAKKDDSEEEEKSENIPGYYWISILKQVRKM